MLYESSVANWRRFNSLKKSLFVIHRIKKSITFTH